MNMAVHFATGNDVRATPQHVFDALHNEFGFTLDPCANADNAKCPRYFTEADDGLAQSWGDQVVFMNPPYSRIARWMEKAFHEARGGGNCCLPHTLPYRYALVA